MSVVRERLDITFLKLIVVGEPRVGKTSLIRTMKEGEFREKWDDWGEDLVRKIVYWPEGKISLQMGEVQLDGLKELPAWATEARGVLLLYDRDDKETIELIRNKWYSLVNRHFAQVPLWLIRTKADVAAESFKELGLKLQKEIHAVGFFDCSAKEGRGVNEAFDEIIKHHKKTANQRAVEAANDPLNAPSTMGCFTSMLSNSGPLIRQAFSNLRECVRNPQAFAEQKRTMQHYLPMLNFGLPKELPEKKGEEGEGKPDEQKDKEEKKDR